MLDRLTSEGFIRGSSAEEDSNPRYFSLINIAYAFSAVFHPAAIQDPLYKVGNDFPYSYGYIAAPPDFKSYKIRVYLEDGNSPLFNNPLDGTPFLDDSKPNDNTACNKIFHYYCVGSIL